MKNKYFKSFMLLFTGSLFAQGLSVIFSPLLTRTFSVEILGVYTYLLSTATIFMPVVNLRYDMSIVTVPEKEVHPLIKGSLVIGMLVSVLGTMLYSLYIFLTKNEKLYITIPFFLLLLLSYACINVFTAYNNRERNYKIISKVTVIRSVFQNALVAIAGLLYNGIMTLLVFYSFGQFAGIREQSKSLRSQMKEIITIPLNKVISVLKTEYKQPVFSMPAIFINGLSYSLITIFIERLYDFTSVGFYSMSVRMLGIPLALISGNISRIFFERAVEGYRSKKNFYQEFKKTFILLFLIAIPMTIFLMVFSPALFSFFFGKTWRVAGDFVVILAPMFGVRFIVTTVSPGLIIAGKQNVDLMLQLLFIVSMLVIVIIANLSLLNIYGFLKLISVAFTFVYLVYLWFIYKFSKGEKIND